MKNVYDCVNPDMETYPRRSEIVRLGLSVVLSVFGLMNNQIIGFIQKKKEYAVLYSTSMSKKQLKIMVLFEVLGTFFCGCIFGMGLSDKRRVIPSKLSGGQQQRVSIARAVIASPKIILADEPIGNLDSKAGKEIMSLFKIINDEKNITILQVTHSEESAKYGKKVIRLNDGVIASEEILR